MNQDKETTIQELKDILKKFRDDRDWKQFHNPKDLAEAIKSISIQQTEKLDLSPFIIALTSVQETQLKLIDSMKIKPKKEEWEFAVTRNKKGEIEKVFARNV